MPDTQQRSGFSNLGLPASLLTQLDRLGFIEPTPIQQEAIPLALTGTDLIGIAQTGTGKTLAFGLPIVSRLIEGTYALILAPTRELAEQIEQEFRKLGQRTALLIGGAPMPKQVSQLRARPSVVVATPGRLVDHMMQRTVDLRRVSIAVLDEADRMLDMGFAPSIRRILDATAGNRQTMLFSATMPSEILDLASQYLKDPKTVEIARAGTSAETVDQQVIVVRHEEKGPLMAEILHENDGTVLVFSRTRHGARKLAKAIREYGHTAAEIHSDRTLAQRREALAGFKGGKYRILVATDIAARGIDVKEISLVVNYDVPEHADDYVHRIGRTGRNGHEGRAITIAIPDQFRDVRDIEKLIGMEIPVSPRSTAELPQVNRPKPFSKQNRDSAPRPKNPMERNGRGNAYGDAPKREEGLRKPADRPADKPFDKPKGKAPERPHSHPKTSNPGTPHPGASHSTGPKRYGRGPFKKARTSGGTKSGRR